MYLHTKLIAPLLTFTEYLYHSEFTYTYIFIAWYLINHRDNFTFNFIIYFFYNLSIAHSAMLRISVTACHITSYVS